jgi:hypothetical protein
MRRTPRTVADAREELVQLEQDFTRLQKRIEAVRDSVANALVRLFGEERPALAGLEGIHGTANCPGALMPLPMRTGRMKRRE